MCIWDEEEDNLLAYATQGDDIPQLSHLELHRHRHRHRQSWYDFVPHVCSLARIPGLESTLLRADNVLVNQEHIAPRLAAASCASIAPAAR